ncbi:hypothetical protein [Peptostreptococcus faecalis]|uniref:hypothetical protein n=1 Tax=Peptostreptococcus faecalis TaxID=2045015 RepID=UPI000C7C8466|nr:hypothetical protein [Peptostreptococcus faecalis]
MNLRQTIIEAIRDERCEIMSNMNLTFKKEWTYAEEKEQALLFDRLPEYIFNLQHLKNECDVLISEILKLEVENKEDYISYIENHIKEYELEDFLNIERIKENIEKIEEITKIKFECYKMDPKEMLDWKKEIKINIDETI